MTSESIDLAADLRRIAGELDRATRAQPHCVAKHDRDLLRDAAELLDTFRTPTHGLAPQSAPEPPASGESGK